MSTAFFEIRDLYAGQNGMLYVRDAFGNAEQVVLGGLIFQIDFNTETGVPLDKINSQPVFLPAGTYVENVDIIVTESFSGLESFELGREGEGESGWLVSNLEHNLQEDAPMVARIFNHQVAIEDTPLLVTISQGENTEGRATILVRYNWF